MNTTNASENPSDNQTEGSSEHEPYFPNLRRIADEIRVRIHLAGLDAKDAWAKLETRVHELEGRAQQLGVRAKEQLVELGSTLEHELRELVNRLPGKSDKQEAADPPAS